MFPRRKLIRSAAVMIAIYALANQLAYGQTCPTPELLKNPAKLSKLFPKAPAPKGEFEKTAEYEARANPRGPAGPIALEVSQLRAQERLVILEKPNAAGFPFEQISLPATISYDPDVNRFRFSFGSLMGEALTGAPDGNELRAAMCGQDGSKDCSRKIISFRIEDTLKQLSGSKPGEDIINKGDIYLVFDGGLHGTVQDLELPDITPKDASLLKPRLKVVLLVEPREFPFYRTSFNSSLKLSSGQLAGSLGNFLGLNAAIKCVGILDSESGSVLASAEVIYAKPNANVP